MLSFFLRCNLGSNNEALVAEAQTLRSFHLGCKASAVCIQTVSLGSKSVCNSEQEVRDQGRGHRAMVASSHLLIGGGGISGAQQIAPRCLCGDTAAAMTIGLWSDETIHGLTPFRIPSYFLDILHHTWTYAKLLGEVKALIYIVLKGF